MSLPELLSVQNPVTIALDIVLLILTPLSYVPQYILILKSTNTEGLSPTSVLFNVLFHNIQLANYILTIPSDPSIDPEDWNSAWRAFVTLLGFWQVGTAWLCAFGLVLLLLACSLNGLSPPFFANHILIPLAIFAHMAAFVFPVLSLVSRLPPRQTGIFYVLFSVVVNGFFAAVFVIAQFVPQYREMRRRNGEPGLLSLWSLGFQAVVFVALAGRWTARVGVAPSRDDGREFFEWFVRFELPLRYVLHGFGCAVLLVLYHACEEVEVPDVAEERAPLLEADVQTDGGGAPT